MCITTTLARLTPWLQLVTPELPSIACTLPKTRANMFVHRNASDASTDARRRNASAGPSQVSLSTRVGRGGSGSSTPIPMTKTSTRTRRTTADPRETPETTLLLMLALLSQLAVASHGHLLGSMPTT